MKQAPIFILLLTVCISSCKKQDEWLDVKYNKSDVVPATLKDFQGLLDRQEVMNISYPALPLLANDNYYLIEDEWNLGTPLERLGYFWSKDLAVNGTGIDWQACYQKIMVANVVLEGLKKVPATSQNQAEYSNLLGSAYFFRALNFYYLAQLFAKPYSPATLQDRGIPLKMSADVNEKVVRASIESTYAQILEDLQNAKKGLPNLALYQSRPSKQAAFALLSKVYLAMSDYKMALDNADSALNINSDLIDYNTLNPSKILPLPNFLNKNPEVIFYGVAGSLASIRPNNRARIDSTLYNSYKEFDLRKSVFYRPVEFPAPKVLFKGSYTGVFSHFMGLSTNELYLLKAECLARLDRVTEAEATMNNLLSKRFETGKYTPLTGLSKSEFILMLIQEKRRELPFTAMNRWEDLRRFNLEPPYQTTIIRKVGAETETIAPNDPRYVFQIPVEEIQYSGIEQN